MPSLLTSVPPWMSAKSMDFTPDIILVRPTAKLFAVGVPDCSAATRVLTLLVKLVSVASAPGVRASTNVLSQASKSVTKP